MSVKTCAFLMACGHFDSLTWPGGKPCHQDQGHRVPPRTHQAGQDGGQPHVPAVARVIHLVDELVRGPHVPAHALQGVHAVGEGGDIWGASKRYNPRSVLGAVRQPPRAHGVAQGTRGWRAEGPSAARGSRQRDGQMRHSGENEHRGRWGCVAGWPTSGTGEAARQTAGWKNSSLMGLLEAGTKCVAGTLGSGGQTSKVVVVVVVDLAKGLRDGWIWPWHGGPA